MTSAGHEVVDARSLEVRSTVQAWTQAIATRDFTAHVALHIEAVRTHLRPELFENNATRAEQGGWRFALREVSCEGDTAEAVIDVLAGDELVDTLRMALVRGGEGYLIVGT